MSEVYCFKCGRGYTEQIDKDKIVREIVGEEYEMNSKAEVYRCSDCGYEFIYGVTYNG